MIKLFILQEALNKMLREKWLVENGDADESSDEEEEEESVAKKLILSPRFIAEMRVRLTDFSKIKITLSHY